MTTVEPLMERNFLEYASYVIVDRAIPDVRDGLKPVQRRILYTLHEMDDGKFHKAANVIGETMKLHPHGDASIGEALVVVANKEYFIERQGNYGNIVTGHAAAAPRYIECRLNDLARETLYSKAVMQFAPSYDGRKEEPVFLPAKIPVALMLGSEGIAVGMSTRVLPHNFAELLSAQIDILKHKSVSIHPDFPTGGIVDVSEYDDGRGKVRVRARIDKKDEKTIVIREIPYSTTTESVIASIEAAAQKGKVKIASINDFTTVRAEIEIGLPRGIYADEVVPQLYAYTECEISISSNIVLIKDRHPVEMTVSEVAKYLTERLRDQIGAELEHDLAQLRERKHWLLLERIFIEERVYKRIEKAKTEEAVRTEVYEGLKPFAKKLVRAVSDDDVRRLLEIPIRRISLYDINKNKRDMDDTDLAIQTVELKLSSLTKTTVAYLKELLEKYGKRFPRRTEIGRFEAVDLRAVARQNIKLSYDPETGFFGSEVKGSKFQMTCTEYDRFLCISSDGSYRIIGPDKKTLIPGKVLRLEPFDQENGKKLTVMYRDKQRVAFAKKVHIRKFIRDKEYELIKDKKGRLDELKDGFWTGTAVLDFVPMKRQRVKQEIVDFSALGVVGVQTRGTRMAAKPVAKISVEWGEEHEPVVAETDDGDAPSEPQPPSSDEPKNRRGRLSTAPEQIKLF